MPLALYSTASIEWTPTDLVKRHLPQSLILSHQSYPSFLQFLLIQFLIFHKLWTQLSSSLQLLFFFSSLLILFTLSCQSLQSCFIQSLNSPGKFFCRDFIHVSLFFFTVFITSSFHYTTTTLHISLPNTSSAAFIIFSLKHRKPSTLSSSSTNFFLDLFLILQPCFLFKQSFYCYVHPLISLTP